MRTQYEEIRIRGRRRMVPAALIGNCTAIVTGGVIKLAQIKHEELVEGEVLANPQEFISSLKQSGLDADVFTFAERPPQTTPRYDYHVEWDNWAAIPITTFREWWENRLPQESRKNVRRAEKRGVVVRSVAFTDELVSGIKCIYDETPVRQGRRFWHFGKGFEAVKAENGTYCERSEFIGAFFHDELIGFVKIIYVDHIATIVQILSMNQHHDKRPMNALLAHTVQICSTRKTSFLVYGKYTYGKNKETSLGEFKRRNGFEELRFPRYYIPLKATGKLAIACGLHLGISNVVPSWALWLLRNCRSRFYEFWSRPVVRKT